MPRVPRSVLRWSVVRVLSSPGIVATVVGSHGGAVDGQAGGFRGAVVVSMRYPKNEHKVGSGGRVRREVSGGRRTRRKKEKYGR